MSPITDSQIGLQRTAGMRRAERTTMSGAFGIVTNHVVAKMVSLLFAAVLVILIDRELEETLLDADFEVRAGSVTQTGAAASGRRQLVLETEPGIAVRFFKPEQVRVTIKGQQKLADAVKRVSVAVVPIKAEWLKVDVGGDKHSISRAILGSDVRIGIPGVEITLDPSIQVDLDPEVPRDVPLKAWAREVAPGLVAEVTFEPPEVRVHGPESLFAGGGMDQITVPIPTAGRTTDFQWELTALPDEVLQKQVRMAPDQRITARIHFSKGEQDDLVLKDIPIKVMESIGNEYRSSLVGLPKNAVTANFAGTPEAVAYWNEHLDELRKLVVAVIDTSKLANKVSPQPGAPASDYIDVEILKVPANLKFTGATPAQVEVSVIKN